MKVRVKPGSHMPPMYLRSSRRYHLDYFSDEWGHMPPATRAIAELYRRHACKVELESASQPWVNFAGMPAVKTGMSNVAGCFCSHIGTVSQAVPAAMSQVHRRHMRTRLYSATTWTGALRRKLSNHNVFWKQKILKFYATVENLNTVELTWLLRKQPLK